MLTETQVRPALFHTEFRVPDGARAVLFLDGVFQSILRPGSHKIKARARRLTAETFLLCNRFLPEAMADVIAAVNPTLAAEHFETVQTGPTEVALVIRDGMYFDLRPPGTKSVYWKDAGPWSVTLHDLTGDIRVPAAVATAIGNAVLPEQIKRAVVEAGQIGLLSVDGALTGTLEPGVHLLWNVLRQPVVRLLDLREQALDVSGQEILTRDRVSVRVNLAARYRVTDPVKAHTAVKDFADALYRSMQHAFRAALATRSLDELLVRKGDVDGEASGLVRDAMAQIGIDVADVSIKDVILPGEMRDILNKVVTAEKEAEAQVIRRREETNATRALLNTARVMAENPVMMRLKELEALEKIADKVQTLTVHNGTQGLLQDLVSLSAPAASAGPARRGKAGSSSSS